MSHERGLLQVRRSRRLAGVVAVVLFLACGAWIAWHLWGRPVARAGRLFTEARSLRSRGDLLQAEHAAAAAVELDPTFAAAALFAAECAAARKEYARAVEHVRRVDTTDVRMRLRAALLAAKWHHHELHRLADAERAYRTALELAPDHLEAHVGMATLLGFCGRRREAIPHALAVIRQGEPTDLLVLLALENGVVDQPGALELARAADPADPNPLVGSAWHAAESERPGEAIDLLREALRLQPDHPAAHVALGLQLFAARRFDELTRWVKELPAAANGFPESWLVRARMAETEGNRPGAIRCYWESLRGAPESKTANFRLARLLADAGETTSSERFAERVRRIQDLEEAQAAFLFSNDRVGIEAMMNLVKCNEAAGRLWEAYGWCREAVRSDPEYAPARRTLESLHQKVDGIPLRLTIDAENPAVSMDLSNYPLPQFRATPRSPVVAGRDSDRMISFRDDAAATGLRFRYFNGVDGPPLRRMFELTGGGTGVLDYDLDGWPDLFFTQGRRWPLDQPDSEHRDRLFRNQGGAGFQNVSESAGIDESGFGQGLSVGDLNADGFPDLYVANIGANCLWWNNGDGTFADVTRAAGVGGREWTTSCVMADLDGDGLPDIYDVNYLAGDDVFDRVCRHSDGAPRMCMPFDFAEERDRLWLNQGDGRFTDATAQVFATPPGGKGLGAAVWDADGSGRLSLYVANDTTPNYFFVAEKGTDRGLLLKDRGIETGLALNAEGKATASMGIALGDVNDDGILDLHITNFLAEPNTFFVSGADGLYEDKSRDVGLHAVSLGVLGFGTQFLDADLDGRLELFTANGHIDDLRRYERPYRMPAQLFRWNGGQFAQIDAAGLGAYFREAWLGRSAARLDWNRDGRDDLAVSHLEDDSALLTNTTPVAGHYLGLRLVGVRSNRDAIGTIVTLKNGNETRTHQLTAGDGYQASNERKLIFGLGDAVSIDELSVRWPSGERQTIIGLPADRELLLIEGCAAPRED